MSDHGSTTNDTPPPQFSLVRVYLKDASLEAPNSPSIFVTAEQWKPKVTLEYGIETAKLSDDAHDVVLTITITALHADRALFLAEVKQGGVFLIPSSVATDKIHRFLNVRCPRILLPYAREAIDNLVVKAGFPPLMVAPIDFKSAYTERVASGDPQTRADN
jgi:preprotein translocase subunit SecB